MAFYSSCPICTTPLFLCLTVASFQLYLVIGYNGVIFQIRYIFANRWRNLWSFLINVIPTSVGLPFISWWFMIHIDGNSKLTGQTIWKIPTLIPLMTLLKDTNQLSALGAKWKFWVSCSEVFENFKMATAEHNMKGETLINMGHYITVLIAHPWSQPLCVMWEFLMLSNPAM